MNNLCTPGVTHVVCPRHFKLMFHVSECVEGYTLYTVLCLAFGLYFGTAGESDFLWKSLGNPWVVFNNDGLSGVVWLSVLRTEEVTDDRYASKHNGISSNHANGSHCPLDWHIVASFNTKMATSMYNNRGKTHRTKERENLIRFALSGLSCMCAATGKLFIIFVNFLP